MAILAVNAGSSTLKFSVHPLQNQGVLDPVLIGNIQGLEPAGQPRMDWIWQGQRHQRALPTIEGTPFERALHALHGLLAELPALRELKVNNNALVGPLPELRRLTQLEVVRLMADGGKLSIEWAGEGQPVMMTGPAARVYEGQVRL